ncbi:MAG TPA: 30S ribosomal protein S17e [Candidatus Nanoarchaeia archaeon]|nr:30S ribosomal protein S17e [Candidatus Nanoarchaeia archaeon]
MGRIKTTFIKRKTRILWSKHGDKFTTDFTQNKGLTAQYAKIVSKKMKNTIAGYMTRLKKRGE